MGKISLEQSLKAYRVMHAPAKFSWKQHYANETFSSPDMLSCTEDEQIQFKKRLESLNQDDRYLILIGIHVVNMGYFEKYDIGKGRFYGALYLSGFNEPTLRRSVYR